MRFSRLLVLICAIALSSSIGALATAQQQAATGAAQVRTTAVGVYTAEQAAKGLDGYNLSCGSCHLPSAYSDNTFRTQWNGRSVHDLVSLIASTMPQDNPGGLSMTQYTDIVAYILKLNGAPAGKEALPTDSLQLKKIRMELKGASGSR